MSTVTKWCSRPCFAQPAHATVNAFLTQPAPAWTLRFPLAPSHSPDLSYGLRRSRRVLRVWVVLFVLILLSAITILIGGVLAHYLRHGLEIVSFTVLALALLLLTSQRVELASAQTTRLCAEQALRTKKDSDAAQKESTPTILTPAQLAWFQKSPVVRDYLAVLQRRRPGGVILKSDIRGLIILRQQTLGGVSYHATEILVG